MAGTEDAFNTQGELDLLRRIEDGEVVAEEEFCRRYLERLTRLAAFFLDSKYSAARDSDDIAHRAVKTVLFRIRRGGYSHCTRNIRLWGLLVQAVRDKSKNTVRHETRGKRDRNRTLRESDFGTIENGKFDEIVSQHAQNANSEIDSIIENADLQKCLERARKSCHRPEEESILDLHLLGESDSEIARQLDIYPAKVGRTLKRIIRQVRDELGLT